MYICTCLDNIFRFIYHALFYTATKHTNATISANNTWRLRSSDRELTTSAKIKFTKPHTHTHTRACTYVFVCLQVTAVQFCLQRNCVCNILYVYLYFIYMYVYIFLLYSPMYAYICSYVNICALYFIPHNSLSGCLTLLAAPLSFHLCD